MTKCQPVGIKQNENHDLLNSDFRWNTIFVKERIISERIYELKRFVLMSLF